MAVMMISTKNDCMIEPEGVVPKNAFGVMSKINAKVPLAKIDPNVCDII